MDLAVVLLRLFSATVCPALDSGLGTLLCNDTINPVFCVFSCPAQQYFREDGALKNNQTVTCDIGTAQWSHVSAHNPLGSFPVCSELVDPESYTLRTSQVYTGSNTCPENAALSTALTTTLTDKTDTAYNCLDTAVCSIPAPNVSCSVNGTSIIISFLVQLTAGDLSSSSLLLSFRDQLGKNILVLSVGSARRRRGEEWTRHHSGGARRTRAAVSLSSSGELKSEVVVDCGAASGTVGTSCIVCVAGQYKEAGECTECPVNSYSSSVQSTECKPCSGDLGTVASGSDSESDCTVMCEVAPLTGGLRSPAVGYRVWASTSISTYCNTNHSVEYSTSNTALCRSPTQPSCHKMCTIASMDEGAVGNTTAGSLLSYKEQIFYTCTEDETNRNLTCSEAGAELHVTCTKESPHSYTIVLIGAGVGVLLVGVGLVVIKILKAKSKVAASGREPT